LTSHLTTATLSSPSALAHSLSYPNGWSCHEGT
jgi:hypothetical protein